MDSVASLVIFVFIIKAAYDIFKDAIDKMVDHSCDDKTEREIRDCVMGTRMYLELICFRHVYSATRYMWMWRFVQMLPTH